MNKSPFLLCVVFCFIFIQFSNTSFVQTKSYIPTPTNNVASTEVIIPAYQKHFYNLFEAGVDVSFYEQYWSSADVISKKMCMPN